MSKRIRLLAWIPPFLTGAALAAGAETAAAVLLYSGEGLLRALSLIVGIEALALGFGLSAVSAVPSQQVLEAVRRRWLFTLVSFLAAAGYAAAWTMVGSTDPTAMWQGSGLALMAGLPLFAGGALLGQMTSAEALFRGGRRGGMPPAHALAFMGAGVALLLTAPFLLPHLTPPSIFLVCMVALSGAALLYGRVLDAERISICRESRPSPFGPVEVTEWIRGRPGRAVRVLLENGRLRGAEARAGIPAIAAEAAVLSLVEARGGEPKDILVVGGGALSLPRGLRRLFPRARIRVVEENPEVLRLARRHFATGVVEELEVVVAPAGWEESVKGPFDLVVVETSMPGWACGAVLARLHGLRWVKESLDADGSAVLCGVVLGEEAARASADLTVERAAKVFSRVLPYVTTGPRDGELTREDGEPDAFLVLTDSGTVDWPREVAGACKRWERALGVAESGEAAGEGGSE